MSIKAIHDTTRGNRGTIHIASSAICIACKTHVRADTVVEYVDQGMTAICPACGVDALIPNPTKALIDHLNSIWFDDDNQ